MRIWIMALLALVGVATVATEPVRAQKAAATGPVIEIGGKRIALVMPEGHCVFERSQPKDAGVIAFVERVLAGRNTLHLTTAECTALQDWRDGRRQEFGNYTQVQSHVPLHAVDFTGQERKQIATICSQFRTDGESITKDVTATIRKQLETGRERVELQNVALLGALDEDDNGCYVGMLIKSASAGGMRTRLCVFANAILNGRLVYLYIFSDTVDEDNVKRLLADRKAAAKAHVEANRRPL